MFDSLKLNTYSFSHPVYYCQKVENKNDKPVEKIHNEIQNVYNNNNVKLDNKYHN